MEAIDLIQKNYKEQVTLDQKHPLAEKNKNMKTYIAEGIENKKKKDMKENSLSIARTSKAGENPRGLSCNQPSNATAKDRKPKGYARPRGIGDSIHIPGTRNKEG